MKAIDRLKLELSNQPYFTDEEYTQFLTENNIDANKDYIKDIHQYDLLQTVIDIFEAVSNDINVMRSISTSFASIGQAYEYIQNRIEQTKDKQAAIPLKYEGSSCFSMMFVKGKQQGTVAPIPIEDIQGLK